MNLYLVRHAEALQIGGAVARDADRMLSGQGERDAAALAVALTRLEPAAPRVITSPLLRSRRTGEILAAAFAHPSVPEIWKELAPGIPLRELLARIKEITDGPVILVGHQPDLGTLIACLIADGPAEIAMPTCAVACLSLQPGATAGDMRLRWLLTPELLRTLSPAQ